MPKAIHILYKEIYQIVSEYILLTTVGNLRVDPGEIKKQKRANHT